ncbi:hypothetical protein PoB_005822000 [Plakobranchus ocellatus]|uniref:C2H2-type domain-containing protein n=1 Tax=Plakobranchus ocellatus TaxID=259542 RepID=A0AAV4CIS4_9GAST|nr:hypothetical protein PoB_005822000 [Plakobranchus ocellatus]
MKTPKITRNSNASKGKSVLKSALAKKRSSKGQKVKKSVRFDLLLRVAPSDDTLYRKCVARYTGGRHKPALLPNDYQLKSRSCEDLMRHPCQYGGVTSSPWQSFTCLARPPGRLESADFDSPPRFSPALYDGFNSSQKQEDKLLPNCSSGRKGPSLKGKSLCRSPLYPKDRAASCKTRIPTPRSLNHAVPAKHADCMPDLPSCSSLASPRTFSGSSLGWKEFHVPTAKISHPKKFTDRLVPSRIVDENSRECYQRDNGCKRAVLIDDLSTSIKELQIATMKAEHQGKSFPQVAEQDYSSTTHASGEKFKNNTQTANHRVRQSFVEFESSHGNYNFEDFGEMEVYAVESATSSGSFANNRYFNNACNGGTKSDCAFNKNNNFDEEQIHQEISSDTLQTSSNCAIPHTSAHLDGQERRGTLQSEDTSSAGSTSYVHCSNETGNNSPEEDLCHGNNTHMNRSNTNRQAIKDLLEQSCSAEAFSTQTRSTDSLKIPDIVNEEIDEDFWEVVCQLCPDDTPYPQTVGHVLQTEDLQVGNEVSTSRVMTAEHFKDETTALTKCAYGNKSVGVINGRDRNQSHGDELPGLSVTKHSDLSQNTELTYHKDNDVISHGLQRTSCTVFSKAATSSCFPLEPFTSSSPSTVYNKQHNSNVQNLEKDPPPQYVHKSPVHDLETASVIGDRKRPTNTAVAEKNSCTRDNKNVHQSTTEDRTNSGQTSTELLNNDHGSGHVGVEAQSGSRDKPCCHQAQTLYLCPVLNCGLQFSNQFLLNDHLEQMRHSPCNPLATILDGVQPPTGHFLCPLCGDIFEASDEPCPLSFTVRIY